MAKRPRRRIRLCDGRPGPVIFERKISRVGNQARPFLLFAIAKDKRMTFGMRKSERVNFERGVEVFMMGIDGTWRRSCLMVDVSQTGAQLLVEESIEGLDLKEFFLLLSSTGLAYRRCRLVRVSGDQIGIEFLAREKISKKRSSRQSDTTLA
jgi:hypothetical protein